MELDIFHHQSYANIFDCKFLTSQECIDIVIHFPWNIQHYIDNIILKKYFQCSLHRYYDEGDEFLQ